MDCNRIRRIAAEALISCQVTSFPINCFSILKHYGFRVYTYQELRAKSPDLYRMCLSYSKDAFTIRTKNLIAYNGQMPQTRTRFSLMHELGHHLLEHQSDSPENEQEADYFASNILAPRVVIYYSDQKTNQQVTSLFHLSSIAAHYALQDHAEWYEEIRREGLHRYDQELYQQLFNRAIKQFVYSVHTCDYCGAKVYNCLDFHGHCPGGCAEIPPEPRRRCTKSDWPVTDDDRAALRRWEHKWLYDF